MHDLLISAINLATHLPPLFNPLPLSPFFGRVSFRTSLPPNIAREDAPSSFFSCITFQGVKVSSAFPHILSRYNTRVPVFVYYMVYDTYVRFLESSWEPDVL